MAAFLAFTPHATFYILLFLMVNNERPLINYVRKVSFLQTMHIIITSRDLSTVSHSFLI